ncbi:MAG TPA: hypothetical protein VJ821_12870 [Anaerolineales bacterium]|nr:hypothetical protein [Anaerolineales bacterium]
MIPTAIFIVVLVIVLVISYRRMGRMSGRNILHVVIGFLGWFLINTLLWVWVRRNESGTEFINPARLLPMLVTIVGLIALYRNQRWIFLGILSAILVNAIGTLLAPPVIDSYSSSPLARVITMLPFYLPFFLP